MSNINSEVSSYSTEPEAGTLSQSEFELGVEGIKLNEFFKSSKPIENDAQSEVSDLQSFSSSKFRAKDNRKSHISIITALKNENLMLKAALDRANMIDISNVQTKLRVTQNDLILYKQYNSELKDRVQELESRLFEALQQQKKTGVSRETLTDKSHHEKIRSLISKNDHLSRLIKSYERRILNMQAELDSVRLKDDIFTEDTVVHVQSSYENDQYIPTSGEEYNRLGSGKVSSQLRYADSDLTPELQALIREQAVALMHKNREADRKTIGELAREVKRLTALLPRKLLSADNPISELKGEEAGGSSDGKEHMEDQNSVAKQDDSLLGDDRIVFTNITDSSRIMENSGSTIQDNESDPEPIQASRKTDSTEVDRRGEERRTKAFSFLNMFWTVLKMLLIIVLLIVLTLVGLVVIFG